MKQALLFKIINFVIIQPIFGIFVNFYIYYNNDKLKYSQNTNIYLKNKYYHHFTDIFIAK